MVGASVPRGLAAILEEAVDLTHLHVGISKSTVIHTAIAQFVLRMLAELGDDALTGGREGDIRLAEWLKAERAKIIEVSWNRDGERDAE